MAIFKNLKDKVSNTVPSSLTEKINISNIGKNIGGLTNNITGRWDEIKHRFSKMWGRVMDGDFSALPSFFSQLNNQAEDDGTKKDCLVPNRLEVEDFYWEKGYTPHYMNLALVGEKTFYSDGGKTMFNDIIMFLANVENLNISFSINIPDYDLPEGLKDSLEALATNLLQDPFTCSFSTEKQIIFSKCFAVSEITEQKELELLTQINIIIEAASRKVYDYLLPIYEEIERKEREQAQKEARREGLNSGYIQTVDNDTIIKHIQENFTEEYPYLRIGFFMVKTIDQANREGGSIKAYDSDLTLSKVRSFKGYNKIRIGGDDTPETLEKRFRQQTGLAIKICGNDSNGERFYISKDSSDYKIALYDLNENYRQNGNYQADIY